MLHHFTDHVNWVSFLLSTLAYFLIGAIWYSFLFSKAWVRLSNIDMNDPNAKKGAGAIMGISFIFMAISCVGLTIFRQLVPMNNYTDAFHLGILLSVGFSTPAISIGYLYTKKPFALYLIDCGYHIVGLTTASVVMHYLG